ncbi:MAG: MarR family winged helix-turn-helix transcriptional regulator [Verrucomicrobiota bacterium]|jgi:DNA-binding MarR family transcriptional regulator
MSRSFCCGPTRAAILAEAGEQSPEAELKCHALLGLLQACHSLQRALRREIAPNSLTESGFCILACLNQHELLPANSQALARELSLSPPVVVATLGRLEISGLVARERSQKDHRVLALKITAAGRRALADTLSHYLKCITGVMSVLDPHDVATLDLACARLREASAHDPASAS